MRADRRAVRREIGAEARVQPGDLEIEVDHRQRIEQGVDRALRARSRQRVPHPMGTVHQLGCRDGRDRDVLIALRDEQGVEIDVRALGRDQDAGIN